MTKVFIWYSNRIATRYMDELAPAELQDIAGNYVYAGHFCTSESVSLVVFFNMMAELPVYWL